MAEKIIVEKISADRSSVSLLALNIKFTFVRESNGGIKLVSKIKPGSRVYDPGACWVPKNVFTAVCRKAGAILRSKA